MPKPLPKPWPGKICALFPSRPMISSICKQCIACATGSYIDVPRSSTRSAASCWTAALSFAKGPANLRNRMPATGHELSNGPFQFIKGDIWLHNVIDANVLSHRQTSIHPYYGFRRGQDTFAEKSGL